MRALLAGAILLLGCVSAHAQTMVLACTSPWGVSENCQGCSGLKWTAPDANDYVQSPSAAYWTKLGTLAAAARVSIATGKTEGATASCAQITGTAAASELLGGPVTPPPPPPVIVTGESTLTWTVAPTCQDGSALSNCTITGYRIDYGIGNFGSSISLAPDVLTYTFSGLAVGTYQASVVALAGTLSAASNPVTFVISASQTCGAMPALASQGVACPAGTTGNWTQTHGWTSSAYPTCWTAQPWTPTTAPTGACTPVAEVWKTATSRPVYEAVLNATSSALVRGNQEGTVAAGVACGSEAYKVSTNSYRDIPEASAGLTSPTYVGRRHTAICAKQ